MVKVFATVRPPDLARPWTKLTARDVSGSGFVIEGRRIVTNAHVVLYASQVQVQSVQAGDKFLASVESIAPGIDLAVLKLTDEGFFDTHPPLPRSQSLPKLRDTVSVYGFPTGGTNLSVTQGIVSRVEFAAYNYPVNGLRVQIDAALNPGNSGGPAVVGDQMIGVAFSGVVNAQNIGYVIPTEEVNLFLADIADGHYDGKPAIYDEFQTLENPALRSYLKADRTTGLVVRDTFADDSSYPLKKWDIVTRIGDIDIDDQGNIPLDSNIKVRFSYAIQHLAKNGTVPLTIVRQGARMNVDVPVRTDRPKLIGYLHGEYPDYFIAGPLVFTVATEDYVSGVTGSSNTNGAALANSFILRGNPLETRRGDQPAFKGEELVMIAGPFFSHVITRGYSPPTYRVVESLNGTHVKNLLHLVELLRDSKDELLVFTFAGQAGEDLVFRRDELLASTEEVLNDNGIRAQGSAAPMAAWGRGR